MVGPIDSLLRVRLDTLPAAELRHLAAPWCDVTPPAAADTLASLAGGGVPAADAVSAAVAVEERVGAYTKEGLRVMVERWHRAREIYRDVDASTLFGPENSLSYGAQRDTLAAAADSLASHDMQSAGAPVADTLALRPIRWRRRQIRFLWPPTRSMRLRPIPLLRRMLR